ncbi:3-phytase [Roseivirga pacifica]|uniref:3-phytase n=1 Tax=Roseivirga pacifica TaxID=1267423 RepID=A0A1I0PXP8_9BACT|nr:phytase [Roseivirga pacifica]RKQ43438.1 3-phytase [Roseivirga pacifica]SEW19330.1 3-phytase [Roseivirga pacifica]
MKHLRLNIGLAAIILFAAACQTNTTNNTETTTETVKAVKPVIVTEPVVYDTDDPAIWVNPEDASKSLIVGTDKNEDGALFVFDLEGKIVQDKVVRGLKRPNNVDIAYGLNIGGKSVDIALTGERMTHNMRLFSLPDMQPLDGGGIPVFEGETGVEYRDLMGVALYKRPADGAIFAIMGRKTGPTDGTYLWQYLLEDNGQGGVKATLVRKFGMFSGNKEIEAIAVDDELGYIYYSDEGVGVRKYYADPEKGNEELALFATEGFTDDHEGISIFDTGNGKGFILVSDQQASQFKIYPREGSATNPHDHTLIESVLVSTVESDGSEISNVAFNATFKRGIFVAMSDDKTFQYYRVEDILPLD